MVIIVNVLLSLPFRPSLEFLLVSMVLLLKEAYQPFELSNHLYGTILMADSLSSILALLSCWITIITLLAMRLSLIPLRVKLLAVSSSESTINTLLLVLLLFFYSNNNIWFFFFFEFSLFPIFFLILENGYQSERLSAVFFFLIYTVLFSVPFLMTLLFSSTETVSMLSVNHVGSVWSFFLLLVLIVKMPLFFTHYWLPKAHVEAPVVGSIVLAGVLLNIGGYGILRFIPHISPLSLSLNIFSATSLMGAVIASLVCLLCNDVKQLVAYSSVSHINFIILGALEGSNIAINACLMLMVMHGISSSGIFYLADLIYMRSGSRSFFLNNGILSLMPLSAFWVFLNIIAGSAVPPFLSSFSELLIFSSIFFNNSFFFFFLFLYAFLSAFYQFYFYYCLIHGIYENSIFFFPFSLNENICIFMHNFFFLSLIFISEFFII